MTKLNAKIIQTFVGASAQIEVFEKIDSTNAYLKRIASNNYNKKIAIVASEQTHGYGRQQRPFISPKQTGLYLSVMIPRLELASVGQLTTAVAVVTARILDQIAPQPIEIKWVNDLILNDRKVAGILTEAVADASGIEAIVIGVGINLTPNEVPISLDNKMGFITDQLAMDPNYLVAQLIQAIYEMTADLPNSQYLDEYRRRNIVLNKQVTLKMGKQEISGLAIDIDADGQLIVQTDQEIRSVGMGEITKLNLNSGPYRG